MQKIALFGVACCVLLFGFLVGSKYYKNQQAEKIGFMAQENVSTFVRDHSMTRGSDDAKVYLVEFMDPACETCAAFAPFIRKMMEAYPGKIKLVVRYAPFHDGSEGIVKILEATKKQGKYWEALEIMFRMQDYWVSHHKPQPEKLWQLLPKVGLDIERLKKDMNDPSIEKVIAQDIADAETLNVRKTPGYFVNGKPLQTFGDRQLLKLVQSAIMANYPN